MSSTVLGLLGGADRLLGVFAVGGGGTASSLTDRIGEHVYYCWGKGICTVGSGFLGTEVNVDTIVLTVIVMAVIVR